MNTRTPSRIVFFGTPDFAAASLSRLVEDERYSIVLVVAQPDRPAGRGKRTAQPPVKQVALKNDLPILQPESLRKSPDFLSRLQAFGPIDAGVVVAFGQILPENIFQYPSIGCINVHASLLPRWRGAAPIQRALAAGDSATGVCLMQLESGLDCGPVFCSAETVINTDDTGQTLHDRLADMGAQLLIDNLQNIITGGITSMPQDESLVTHADKIEKEEGLIDWNSDSRALALKIKAFAPSPGAYTYLESRRLKILFAAPLEEKQRADDAVPGEIVASEDGALEIRCGSGYLNVNKLQLEGKRAMPVADFLKGYSLQTGARFTSTPD